MVTYYVPGSWRIFDGGAEECKQTQVCGVPELRDPAAAAAASVNAPTTANASVKVSTAAIQRRQ